MLEHFFIVRAYYENGKPQFIIDTELEENAFPQGTVIDSETDQWLSSADKEHAEDNKELASILVERMSKA